MKITTKTNNGREGKIDCIDRIYINQDGIEYMIEPEDKGCLKICVFGMGNRILIEPNSRNNIILKANPKD